MICNNKHVYGKQEHILKSVKEATSFQIFSRKLIDFQTCRKFDEV